MAANPGSDSSNKRKVAVPAVAGALTILLVIGLQAVHVPLTTEQYAIGAPALSTVLTFLADVFLPDRFLA